MEIVLYSQFASNFRRVEADTRTTTKTLTVHQPTRQQLTTRRLSSTKDNKVSQVNYCTSFFCNCKNTKQVPKVIWEELRRHSSLQKMDSPTVCASCAVPTADKSNHLAEGTTHPHRRSSAT